MQGGHPFPVWGYASWRGFEDPGPADSAQPREPDREAGLHGDAVGQQRVCNPCRCGGMLSGMHLVSTACSRMEKPSNSTRVVARDLNLSIAVRLIVDPVQAADKLCHVET